MPRKTKEQNEIEEKKSTPKKTTTKSVKSLTKKSTTKTTPTKKTETKKNNSSAKRTTTTTKKKTSTTKTKKTSVKGKKTTNVTKKAKKVEVVEYYDLPYRYNQTIVRVLAQTPTNLFIYWDISDEDRKSLKEQYGEYFFENSHPILIVHNDTKNYSFEIDINDFANSWYLHVSDSKCQYRIELGRRPNFDKKKEIKTDYIYITTSNNIEAPNDKILFNPEQKIIQFKNVKTGYETSKPITEFSFINTIGKLYNIYNIYDFYKEIYKNENIEDLSNPSSSFSSFFK